MANKRRALTDTSSSSRIPGPWPGLRDASDVAQSRADVVAGRARQVLVIRLQVLDCATTTPHNSLNRYLYC